MLDLIFGTFLLCALYLAFKEDREEAASSLVLRPSSDRDYLEDPFSESVYDAPALNTEPVLVKEEPIYPNSGLPTTIISTNNQIQLPL